MTSSIEKFMLMPMNGSGMEILSMCVNIIAHDHTAGNQIINPVIAPGFLFLSFDTINHLPAKITY
ncbi:TPA: hypothetical protein ACISXX_000762 [Salmonella enterica subsp. diarizonae serovar 61:l,v:z35]